LTTIDHGTVIISAASDRTEGRATGVRTAAPQQVTGLARTGRPKFARLGQNEHMTQPSFNPYGAVDLSTLARPAAAAGGPGGSAPTGAGPAVPVPSLVVDVAEADFQELVIDTSMTVPVVIDFWADWCGPCKQLSPVLEKLANAGDGRWILAKIDVDANQRLGQAFQVQSIPSVFAVVKGQPIPLFQGAYPEDEVARFIDELLRVSEANGVNGRVTVADAAAPVEEEEPVEDPRYDAAYDAIERGDLDAAADAYRELLTDSPGDPDAQAGLAQVELLRRTQDLDPAEARAAAAAAPDDVAAQTRVADLDLLGGHVEDAFGRLVELVRRTSGDERNAAREHLVSLFELVGTDDPRVAKARTALANALF
jgi:putative thioredoxin